MDYQLAKRGIRLTGAYEVQHHATAISLVAAGVGCAILPASTLEEGDRLGVCRIPLIGPVVKRKVILSQRKNSTLSPAANAFFELEEFSFRDLTRLVSSKHQSIRSGKSEMDDCA